VCVRGPLRRRGCALSLPCRAARAAADRQTPEMRRPVEPLHLPPAAPYEAARTCTVMSLYMKHAGGGSSQQRYVMT
jgi:hypothetical protein